MPQKSSPFSGLPLSVQTDGPLDQRLFGRPSPPAPTTPPVSPLVVATEPPPAGQPVPAGSRASLIQKARQLKPSSLQVRFDLGERPLYKVTYPLTQEEVEALEDLKLELSRALDTAITKNELLRAALHLLVEDYVANGEQSYVVQKLARPAKR